METRVSNMQVTSLRVTRVSQMQITSLCTTNKEDIHGQELRKRRVQQEGARIQQTALNITGASRIRLVPSQSTMKIALGI
jgi:hypothetical protein